MRARHPATGRMIDLDAFCERWMTATMTDADDELWAELVETPAIRAYVLDRVGYALDSSGELELPR